MIPTIEWRGDSIVILDQRALPEREEYLHIRSVDVLCDAIATLAIRGAPALGIAGAYGVALAARVESGRAAEAERVVREAASRIAGVRPTAVNLAWGVERTLEAWKNAFGSRSDARAAAAAALEEARRIHEEDLELSRRMGRAGAALLPDPATVITHCNTGGLATGGLGTALAVVFEAHRQGKQIHVYADETRPLLQGARLTAWELLREGIGCTVMVDGAAAALMSRRKVDAVLVGADRIARNGDVANKVGTYGLAVAAAHHGVPFYVVAPSTSFDPSVPDGSGICIEERPADEVRTLGGVRVAPENAAAWNPAFDVTPSSLVSGWISEQGLVSPPFD